MGIDRQTYFEKHTPIYKGEATGRLDVMGGIADYSGSLVLQMPIKESTRVFLSPMHGDYIEIFSNEQNAQENNTPLRLPLENVITLLDSPNGDGSQIIPSWTKYIVGAWPILERDKSLTLPGARIWIESDVPVGKGVSSSAALEIATLRAISEWKRIKWKNKYEMPVIGQRIENEVVGAPCGIMDQMAICIGISKKLLPLLCQPYEAAPLISLPEEIHFVGLDSGTRHEVSGESYSDVRAAAFMGYSIIAHHATDHRPLKETDLPYGGYLANVTKEDFVANYQHLIPRQLSGQDFINRYEKTIDKITQPRLDKIYKVRTATAHPIFENNRIKQFQDLLVEYTEENRQWTLEQLGKCMYESHLSYSKCGLGSSATDRIVEIAQELGPHRNIFGARITGGGNGGTVCILAYGKEGLAKVKEIKQIMEDETGKTLTLFLP